MNRRQLVFAFIMGFILGGLPMIDAIAQVEKENGWDVIVCNPLLRSLEMESTWAAAKAIGVTGLEINVSPDLVCSSLLVGKETPYRMDTPDNAKKILQDAQTNGLLTPVICAPISLDSKAENTGAPEWAKTVIENAPYAGVKLIYFPIGAGSLKKPGSDDAAFIQRSIALLKDLVECGEKNNVIIAIENLNVFWNRPEITLPVFEAFKPDRLGLCLDPINLYWFGHPRTKVYEIVREYMPHAKHFHVKNVAHPEDQREAVRTPGWKYGENSVPAAEGDLDFKEILTWLRNGGYQGCISIEDDSLGHFPVEKRVEVLRQDVQYLRDIIQSLKP